MEYTDVTGTREFLRQCRPGVPPLQAVGAPGEAHDCWTTTESALTRDLPEDLCDAWDRLRESASGLRRAANLTGDPNVTLPHQLDPSRFALSGTCSTSYGTNGLARKHHYPGRDCSCPEMTSNATLRRSLAPADLLLSPSLPSFCGQSTAERTRQYSTARTAALVDQQREAWNNSAGADLHLCPLQLTRSFRTP